MGKIYLIVEGDGEVQAVPELIRRILYEKFNRYDVVLAKPYNAHGNGNLTVVGGLERFLGLTRRQSDCIGVLALLDAEEEHLKCPPSLILQLARRTRKLRLPFPAVVVCAVCEYESWFLTSLHTIGANFLNPEAVYTGDPEHECGAKGWLSHQMPPGQIYKETQDQVRMTTQLDLAVVESRSGSFRLLIHAIEVLLKYV